MGGKLANNPIIKEVQQMKPRDLCHILNTMALFLDYRILNHRSEYLI